MAIPKTISYHRLKAAGACPYALADYRKVFGTGVVPLTLANWTKAVRHKLNVGWFFAKFVDSLFEKQAYGEAAFYGNDNLSIYQSYLRRLRKYLVEHGVPKE